MVDPLFCLKNQSNAIIASHSAVEPQLLADISVIEFGYTRKIPHVVLGKWIELLLVSFHRKTTSG